MLNYNVSQQVIDEVRSCVLSFYENAPVDDKELIDLAYKSCVVWSNLQDWAILAIHPTYYDGYYTEDDISKAKIIPSISK